MATNMDTRVVELKFENREFERNIAQSTKSVEELKEAMDFEQTSRGLEKFSRAFDFSNIENNLQRLTDKFTGFGDVAEYVISRIRRSIESAAYSLENFIRSMSTAQISVGQGKYDQMNKSVMTIISSGKATEDQAYDIMERIMAYTDQTSHSFNTMVTQLSNLTSTGMGLEEAERLLEGIGNAATFAGQNADNAALSMSVLSKSMSPSSVVMIQQYDQLANTARVVTDKWKQQALEAAAAVGTLTKKNDKYYTNVKGQKKGVEVNEANLRDMLRYRWLTGSVLQEMYKSYEFGDTLEDLAHPENALDSFGKTAYLTGQRALTFADAMNAVRESVSSGWMESFRTIFGDVTEAAEHFTNICNRIIEFVERIKGFRNELLSQIVARGGRDSLMQLLLGDYENDVKTGAVGLMDMLDGLADTISKGFWDFILAINPGVMLDEQFSKDKWEKNSEYRMYTLSNMVVGFLEKIRGFFEEVQRWLNEEIEVNGKVTTRMQMIQNIITGFVGILALGYYIAEHAYNFLTEIAADLDPSVTAIIDLLSRLGLAIFDTATDTEKAGKFQKFFEDLRTTLQPVTDGINNVVTSFTRLLEVLFGLDEEDKDRSGTFDGIGKAILWVADILAKVIGPILDFVSSILDAFTMLLEKGITPESVEEFGKQLADAFKTMFKSFVDNLPDSFSFIKDFIYDLFGLWDPEDEKKVEERANTFGTFLHKLFTGEFGGFGQFVSNLFNGFNLSKALDTGLGIGSAMNFMQTVAGAFKNTNLYTILLGFLGVATVASIFSLIMNIRKAIRYIGGFFSDVGGSLVQGATGRYEWYSEKIINIAKAIGILVACIVVLSALDTGRLVQGVIALGVIIGGIIALFYFFQGPMFGDAKLKQTMASQAMIEVMIITLSVGIALIVAAVAALILSLTPLAALGWGAFGRAMLSFVIILGGIGAFIVLMLGAMKGLLIAFGGGKSGKHDWKALAKIAIMMGLIAAMVVVLAAAVAILAVALIPFAMMSWGGWARAVGGLAALLTIMGAFISVMLLIMKKMMVLYGGGASGRHDFKALGKIAVALIIIAGIMVILAAAVAILAVALMPFAIMSWGGLARAGAALAGIFTIIGAFMTIMLTIMKKQMALYGGGASGKHDFKALAKIAAVLIVISAIMVVLAAAMAVFAVALTPFAIMSWGGLARAGAALIGILAIIGTFITVMLSVMKKQMALYGGGASGNHDFKALAKIALTLIVLAGSMALIGLAVGIISAAVLPMAAIGFDGMINALIGLAAILAIMIGVMTTVKNMKFEGMKLAGFIGFALSVAILMYSLGFVANLDEKQYIRGLVALASIMMMLAIMMAVMKEMKPDIKSAGTVILLLVALGVAMILFSIAFNEVKDIKWEVIAAFAAGISILLVAVAFASKIAQGVTITGILMLALGLAAVLAVIALMAPMVIGGIATGLTEAAGQLVLLSSLMQTFTGRMSGVDEGAMDKGKRIINSMSELIANAISFAFAGGSFTAITSAVSQLNIISGEMIDLTARFNAVDEKSIQHIKTIITRLKGICETTLKGFSSYIQNAKDFSSVMFELGSGLIILNDDNKDIVDPDDSMAIKTIKALAACAGDLDIIAKMNIDDLTSKISGLGGAMILYAEGAKEAKDELDIKEGEEPDVSGAIALMKAITTQLAQEGGITLPENMPEETDIGTFGAQIAALAAALVKFEQAGAGLGEGTDKALETLTFFRDLKQQLTDTDFENNLRAVEVFGEGEEAKNKAGELETFGKNIQQLGIALSKFSNSTTYVDEQTGEIKSLDYSNATQALQDIAGVAASLPSFGGLAGVIIGVKEDLNEFAGEIEALGQALNDFHTKTTTWDEYNKTAKEFDYTNAIGALNSLAKLNTLMPKRGGLAALLEGDEQSLTSWGGDIEALGVALNDFSTKVMGDGTEEHPGFNQDVADKAIKAVDSMVKYMTDLSGKLPKVGGIGKVISTLISGREYNFEDLSNDIGKLGSGLGKLGEGLNTGNWNKDTGVENALHALGAIIEVVKKMAELSAIEQNSGNGYSFGFAAMELASFVDYLTSVDSNAINKIAELMESITTAIDDEKVDKDKVAMFKDMAEALAAFATVDPQYDWKYVGASIDTGIAEGLNENVTIVTEAAKAVAVAAYNAAMEALDANSPSKVFMGVGSYIGLGMAVGIDKSADDVTDAATGMSEKTIESARNMAALISQIMEEEDLGPTISPVLDLTNLESGAASIGGILGGQYGLTLNGQNITVSGGNASSEATMPKDYTDSIGKTNDEIASLRNDVQELASAMRNMKMVMNTGAVVGAIGPDLDRYLGQRGFYAERTNT